MPQSGSAHAVVAIAAAWLGVGGCGSASGSAGGSAWRTGLLPTQRHRTARVKAPLRRLWVWRTDEVLSGLQTCGRQRCRRCARPRCGARRTDGRRNGFGSGGARGRTSRASRRRSGRPQVPEQRADVEPDEALVARARCVLDLEHPEVALHELRDGRLGARAPRRRTDLRRAGQPVLQQHCGNPNMGSSAQGRAVPDPDECQLGRPDRGAVRAPRTFTMANSDHLSHAALARRLHAYLRWRNANANASDPRVLDAQRRERARAHSEKGHHMGTAPAPRRLTNPMIYPGVRH